MRFIMPDNTSSQPSSAGLPYSLDYPPPDFVDPVIEVYKKDIDRASIRENLKLTPEERLLKHQQAQAFFEELRQAGQRARQQSQTQS